MASAICNSISSFVCLLTSLFVFLLIDLTANITKHKDVLYNSIALSNSMSAASTILVKQVLSKFHCVLYLRQLSTKSINILLLLQFAISLLQQTVETSPSYILKFLHKCSLYSNRNSSVNMFLMQLFYY